jgi:hypothetical protein
MIGLNLVVCVLCSVVLDGCGGSTSASSGTTAESPTNTTLQAETANNTSANDAFTAQLNGLPKPANVSKVDTHSLLYSGATTKVYAHLLGWFGEGGHMNVGYHSDDPQQVHRQVEDMMSRGIQGAILDWFGQNNHPVVNGAALALRAEAEAHPGFEFAIMEDAGALVDAAKANGCDVTAQLLSDLNYINTQFVPSPAYTRINGRPVIFFFGVDAFYIDWNQVRTQVANNPLFVFRGVDGLKRPISDGGFQWEDINADPFHPASPNPFDPALASQDAFYRTTSSGRLVFGSVYRGFNDSLAPWGIDRFVHPRCGQTWLDSFTEIGKFYSSSNQLPALQLVTWNDYDEGTAMEMGIDNCVYLQPSISGNTLSWTVNNGPEATVDHYTVYSSTDGQNLMKLADVPTGTHSLDLSQFNLSGTVTLYVKATGRPSIENKMSPAIAFHAGDQPPVANIVVSQTAPLNFSVSVAGSTDPDGSIASSKIDFGDGTVVAGPQASHTYSVVGAYNITATVVDNAGASAVVVRRISAKPMSPDVTIFSPTPSGVVDGTTPSFVASANSSNPITQMQLLVDGTQVYAISQDTMNTALKIYTGNHHVEVQAVDSMGAVASAAVDITAEPNDTAPVPALQWMALPQAGPNTVLFCGINWQDSAGFVNAYRWTFPDGSQAFTPGAVHTFPTAGTFLTMESVIDEFGAPASITQSVTASSANLARPTVSVYVQDEQTQKQNLPIRLSQPR